MSEKRENFALMCVLLFSFFLGFLAYLGAAGKPWLNDGWDEPLAVGVGFTVTVLVFRAACSVSFRTMTSTRDAERRRGSDGRGVLKTTRGE
jgi:hypothetical protein